MTTYDVYSRQGADRRFADKTALDALNAEIGGLREQIRAQLLLSNMLPIKP